MSRRVGLLVYLLAGGSMAACRTDSDQGHSPDIRVGEWRTILSPSADDVGTIQALDISPDGQLYIADGVNGRIVKLDPSSGHGRHFGGKGEGPGEFRVIDSISVATDGVLAFDVVTHRVSSFSHDGEFLGVLGTHSQATGPTSLNSRGAVLSPTMGYGGSLARLQRIGQDSALPIGTPIVTPSGKSIRELQADAARQGTWPEDYRNSAVPIAAPDGGSWLVLPVEGVVRAFDASGREQWAQALPEAAVEAARKTYLGRITDPEASGRLWSPHVVSNARLAGDEIWIAFPEIEAGEAGALVLDAATGQVRAVLRFGAPGPVIAVPDPARDRLFVAWPVEGKIDQTDLPAW